MLKTCWYKITPFDMKMNGLGLGTHLLLFVGRHASFFFRYLLGRLKTLCEEAIRKSITLETVCTIFLLAHKHNAEGLKASDTFILMV